ncbi:nuclease-related domain-containing protein [Aliicoccus persicus]|uniref:Nuclease-related domain-containing protein n=1 Tax=Aliicoccus persicus TaxID=930138 RepID=A0A662Z3V1_9STAP|nr:nuclease-related domain-containing protein [Aliicoccus persicus]SEW02597.1 Nuclease-related domain-containing protein [Aliicoccus persicus]
MILTERKPSEELLYYRALSKRVDLSKNQQLKLKRLESGYEGECTYDEVYESIISHLPVFRDVYLEIEGSHVQCDALIVHDNGYLLHEIKNYNGEFHYNGNQWLLRGNEVSEDPIIQLERTRKKFIKLKYSNNVQFNIDGKVVFTHIDFSLELIDTPSTDKIILRNQLKRHLSSLKDLTYNDQSLNRVELIKNNIVANPFHNEKANFSDLKKGVYCRNCSSFNIQKSKFHFQCKNCLSKYTIHTIVLQAISDHKSLFNNREFIKKEIYDILNGSISMQTIYNVLKIYCTKQDKGRHTTYRFKYHDFDEAEKSVPKQFRYKDHVKLV